MYLKLKLGTLKDAYIFMNLMSLELLVHITLDVIIRVMIVEFVLRLIGGLQ